MDYRKYGLAAICVLLLASCLISSCKKGVRPPGLARCTIGEHMTRDDVQGNAGCLIKIDGKAVLVDEGLGISPPGGLPKMFDKGREVAWRTACRETQEEVWAAPIKVEKLLHSFKHFHLFQCVYDAKVARNLELMKSFVKRDVDTANRNDIKVMLVNPKEVPEKAWRFPEQGNVFTTLFEELP